MTPDELALTQSALTNLSTIIHHPDFPTDTEAKRRLIRAYHHPLPFRAMTPKTLPDLARYGAHPTIAPTLSTFYRDLARILDWKNATGPDETRSRVIFGLTRQSGTAQVPDYAEQEQSLMAKIGNWQSMSTPEEQSLFPSSGFISRFLDMGYHSEAPLAYHFYVALALLGVAARRNLYIHRGNHTVRPNMLLFLLGPTAARKSTAINPAKQIIAVTNESIQRLQIQLHAGTTSPQEPLVDRRIAVLADNITAESIYRDLNALEGWREDDIHFVRDSTGIIINDEASDLFGKNAFGAARLVTLLTALFEGDANRSRSTVSHGHEEFRNVCISAIFGSTLEWLQEADETLFKGGFVGRCTHVHRHYTDRCMAHPDCVDPITARFLASKLVPLAMLETPISFGMDSHLPSGKRFTAWYEANASRVRGSGNAKMTAYLQRSQGQLIKIAMLLQLSERIMDSGWLASMEASGYEPLELEYLETAIRILASEEQHLPFLFSEFNRKPGEEQQSYADLSDLSLVAFTVYKLCTEAGKKKPAGDRSRGEITMSELSRPLYRKLSTNDRDVALRALEEEGHVLKRSGEGRAVYFSAQDSIMEVFS